LHPPQVYPGSYLPAMPLGTTVFDSAAAVTEACRKEGKSYVIFEDRVLDVADFTHPGPQALIKTNIGKDITQSFTKQGHSEHARYLCHRLAIGHIGENIAAGKLLPNLLGSTEFTEEECQIHARLDELIDVNKPLMPQVRQLSNREFKALISRPRYVENEDGIQIHEDPARDAEHKRDFGTTVAVLVPVVFFFLVISWASAPSLQDFAFNMAVYFTAGAAILWTAIEYIFHRFLLHRELELDPNAEADPDHLASIFSAHTHHHVFMNQRLRIALTPNDYMKKGLPALVVAFLVLPSAICWPGAAGVLVGSMIYDALHLACHFDDVLPRWVTSSQWFEGRKSAHMRHHYRDNSREFGVSSNLWDFVVGTH